MKHIKNMSQVELAACVRDSLRAEGIHVVLSGGSAVAFYSSNKYVSKDLDLINTGFAGRSRIKAEWIDTASTSRDATSSIPKQPSSSNSPTDRSLLAKSL